MNAWEYLALGLELWTAVGVLGLVVSFLRQERRKLMQGVASLVGVWVIYLGVLLFVSYRQPEQRVPLGRPVCFRAMCFTVERTEEIPVFSGRSRILDRAKLVRVVVQVANGGRATSADEGIEAYLRDAQGRIWMKSAAVSGNPLEGRVEAGGLVASEPVFQLSPNATGLTLVLTHGRWSHHRLVIGDAESFWHRERVMELGR